MKSQIKTNLIKTIKLLNHLKIRLDNSNMNNNIKCETVIINNYVGKPTYKEILTSRPAQPVAARLHSRSIKSSKDIQCSKFDKPLILIPLPF